MEYFEDDLLTLKTQLKESLRCKRSNVCKIVLYADETQELINVLETILNSKAMLSDIYKELFIEG